MFKIILALVLFMSQAFAWDQSKSVQIRGDVASGLATGPNFWKSGDAETADASAMQVYAYADAAGEKPVDCTGGSPTMTVTRSTTALSDKYSWLITKPASNVQGQGIAFELDVDNSVAAVEMMQTVFNYIVRSGTFAAGSNTTNSDLMVYLYDVTDGKLIEPQGGSKLYTSSTDLKGSYLGLIQSTLGSKKYRVCLHQATTSAAAYTVATDNGRFEKSESNFGNANNTFTARFDSGGTISPGSQTGSGHISGNAVLTDTSLFSIPVTGLTSAPNCTVEASTGDTRAVIQAKLVSTSTSSIVVRTGFSDSTGTYAQFTNFAYAFVLSCTKTGADYIRDVQISDLYSGTDIATRARLNSAQSIATATTLKVNLNLAVLDTINAFNSAQNRVDIKSSGIYDLSGSVEFLANATGMRAAYIYRNGSEIYKIVLGANSASGHVTTVPIPQFSIELVAGDYLELYAHQTSGGALGLNTNAGTTLNVLKRSPTSSMSPTAKDETHYAGTAGDAIGTSDTLIKFINKVEDTFGSYNPSTGIWTSKRSGFCSFAVRLGTASVNLSTSQNFFATLYKNGSIYRVGNAQVGNGVSNTYQSIVPVASEKVSPGDTYSVYGRSGVPITAATAESGAYFTVSCR